MGTLKLKSVRVSTARDPFSRSAKGFPLGRANNSTVRSFKADTAGDLRNYKYLKRPHKVELFVSLIFIKTFHLNLYILLFIISETSAKQKTLHDYYSFFT